MPVDQLDTTTSYPAASQNQSPAGDKDDAASLNVPAQRAALVKRMCGEITSAKKHWEPDFKRMLDNIRRVKDIKHALAEGNPDSYRANLMHRHIQERTASLYAKNPRCRAKRKQRMDFKVWDGTQEMLQSAMQMFEQSLQIPDPMQRAETLAPVQDLIDDIRQGKATRDMLSRLGKTLEIMFHYALDESEPRFKVQAKQIVRRALTTGVGWVKLSLQRKMDKHPDVINQINDITARVAHIERLSEDMNEGEIEPDAPEAEELKQALSALQAQPEVLVEEGLVFTFPKSTAIILDPRTSQISGFIGTGWMAEEFTLTPVEIEEIYGVDVGSSYTAYRSANDVLSKVPVNEDGAGAQKKDGLCCIWERFDRKSGVVYTVCDGYPDFLEEPRLPSVSLKRFFPYFSLLFNDTENEENESIYPLSDMDIIWPAQREYNRMREALRQHRIANAPFYATSAGSFEADDKQQLRDRKPHDVLQLKVPQGTKISDVLQSVQMSPVDPNMYEVNNVFTDIQRTTGSQQADFGGTPTGGTATASSIAENSKVSMIGSNTDDLDDMLTDIARCAGEVMLTEFDQQTAQRIAGPGAVWPQLSSQDVADQVFLEIIAGSSGKPNKAADLANFERVSPFLLQTPGISPPWMARTVVSYVDESVDLEEALLDGVPSMIAMNAMASRPAPAGGPPGAPGAGPAGPAPPAGGVPSSQGGHGASNSPAPPMPQPGPQPAFPAPSTVQNG